MTATALDLACVQRLAQAAVADSVDGAHIAHEATAVVLDGRWNEDGWEPLLEAIETRHDVEDQVSYQFRPAQVELADRDVAWALWRLTNTGAPCSRCLDGLTGEPYDVAAKAQVRGECSAHRERVAS